MGNEKPYDKKEFCITFLFEESYLLWCGSDCDFVNWLGLSVVHYSLIE